MLFNSLSFFFFFAIVLILYFRFNTNNQNILLFAAGFFFYSFWNLQMGFLLLLIIYLNYKLGKSIYLNLENNKGNVLFKLGVWCNLFALGYFKYTIFLIISSNDAIDMLGLDFQIPIPIILLPVGISFYTFHNISYLFDIKNRLIKPCDSLLHFAVYDLFFPLLLAGPIERPKSLIPQIQNQRKFSEQEFLQGLILLLWGVFKKVFVADNLSSFVNSGLSRGTELESGMVPWIAFCFAFQVYADFSGYSDAARGMAKMMGFQLMLNFNLPFFATNVSEFWKRWHISLSSWLRDYVYIQLGGNRISFARQNWNIIIVWTLGGLWHGATYGYFIWGIYCGFCIVIYNIFSRYIQNKRIFETSIFLSGRMYLGWLLTFWSFAMGLLLFRVEDYLDLQRMIQLSFGLYWNPVWFSKILFFILPILIVDSIQFILKENESFLWIHSRSLKIWKPVLLPVVMIIGLGLFIGFGIFDQKEFFYFQF
jgi:alginate O-acetyltransferase complex protein AlgI